MRGRVARGGVSEPQPRWLTHRAMLEHVFDFKWDGLRHSTNSVDGDPYRSAMPRRSLHSLIAGVAIAVALAVLAPVTSTAAPSAARTADRDCGDFATQAAAQRFFINAGGPRNDPHRLDADGDGIACETNPCPCSTSQGGGGGGGGQATPLEPPRLKQRAVVVRVIDGDTVDVRVRSNGRVKRVRIIGIDTPEVYGGAECGGPAASKSAKGLMPEGTPVLLVSDPTQARADRYGRLLRYVMKRGKYDMGRFQLKRGHARVFVVGRPFERVRAYRSVQQRAKRADRGLWGHCDGVPAPPPVPPVNVPDTDVPPVDPVLTRAQALLQCTVQGIIDLPLTQENELEQCIVDLIG